MLFLWQTPPVQPIQVTVQSPPGLPAWETSLLSAVVGAFFALLTSTVMEFVRPFIAKWIAKRAIFSELGDEIAFNTNILDAAIWFVLPVKDADDWGDEDIYGATIGVMSGCITRRFATYQEKTEHLLLGIFENESLEALYHSIKQCGVDRLDKPRPREMLKKLQGAKLKGTRWLKRHGLYRTYAKCGNKQGIKS